MVRSCVLCGLVLASGVAGVVRAQTGACCSTDGSCAVIEQGACGGFFAAGSPCVPSLCVTPGNLRFAIIGDYGTDDAGEAAVAARVKAFNPSFIATVGDNTYFANTDITNWDRTQAKYFAGFIKLPLASAYAAHGSVVNNFFPVLGNNDYDVGGSVGGALASWTAYWELPGNERWYSVTRGPVQLFMLSSDSREPSSNAAGGAQFNWFLGELANSSAAWKLVFFHHPAQTSVGNHGPSATMRAWNFEARGVTAVFSGHNHWMERLEYAGVAWFVSGAGGANLGTIVSQDPASAFRNTSQNGFLLADASAARITFRFIASNGATLDTRVIEAPGACCNGTTCVTSVSAGSCTGVFQGAGVACVDGPGNPVGCCRANFDRLGGLSPADIFAFLNAYFSNLPGTDFNADGQSTPSDIFAFLNAYFAGCPQ